MRRHALCRSIDGSLRGYTQTTIFLFTGKLGKGKPGLAWKRTIGKAAATVHVSCGVSGVLHLGSLSLTSTTWLHLRLNGSVTRFVWATSCWMEVPTKSIQHCPNPVWRSAANPPLKPHQRYTKAPSEVQCLVVGVLEAGSVRKRSAVAISISQLLGAGKSRKTLSHALDENPLGLGVAMREYCRDRKKRRGIRAST